MSDYLVRLSANKTARTWIQRLRLPIPLPQVLDRAKGPWTAQPLAGSRVVFCPGKGASLADLVLPCLSRMGADLVVQGTGEAVAGTAPSVTDGGEKKPGPRVLLFDATGLEHPDGLDEIHAFFHKHIRALARCGRTVVLVRPPEETADPLARSARRAVEGFVRSLGRELGRKGSTALEIQVERGAEDRLEPVLHFLLSNRAAYISGQPVHISARAALPNGFAFEQPLKGKTALVTGGARGIGAATARALAREGAKVYLMDRPTELEAMQALAAEIGGEALGCDITEPAAAELVRTRVLEHHEGLDILVHNAGITRDTTLGNMDAERWNLVLDVNLRALIRLNEALNTILRDQGRIICLSSVGGIGGNFGQTNYAASKAGIIGYIQGLAPLLADRGITVNAVAPGFIETKMSAAVPFGTREGARRLSNLFQGGEPEDIAEGITFLASPGAAGLTGEVLRICGGSYIGA